MAEIPSADNAACYFICEQRGRSGFVQKALGSHPFPSQTGRVGEKSPRVRGGKSMAAEARAAAVLMV
jgi:hypothetical protein